MSPELLQFFLLLNVFLVGAAVALALQSAYAHFRPKHHEADKKPQGGHLPPAVRQQLLQQAQADFQAILTRSAAELQHDLQATAGQLNGQLQKLGNRIVEDEMQHYQAGIEKLRRQAEAYVGGTKDLIDTHQAELEKAFAARKIELEKEFAQRKAELDGMLQQELAAEKARLLADIDSKLADAVTSFLMETLQHNVDLGAQSAYLTAMLEENKAELTKGIVR